MTTGVRKIEFARAAWGAALLFAPRVVLTCVHGIAVDKPSLVTARILGGRQLAQAVLSGYEPSPEVLAMGVWVDAAHASSAVALAVLDRSRARAGLVDTVVASTWAAAGYRDIARAGDPPTRHDRVRDRLAGLVLGVTPGGAGLRAAAAAARADDHRQRSSDRTPDRTPDLIPDRKDAR